ncbi:MAG: triose-phosphate isomerase [Planctomycetes bacterium]|nr:triose-phosphate isomerase [Planctomycetota bacterium]
MRKAFIAGNWKMNTDSHIGEELVKGIKDAAQANSSKVDVAVFPPFVYLQQVANAAEAPIAIGSQDIYFEEKGAFTGEISSAMLKDVGCVYALCGHSERRHVIGETNEIVNKKVNASIAGGLLPVLCIGELLEERKAEKTFEVLTEQIKKGLAGLTAEKVSAVTLAYEPVWAIGTGLTATGEQAQEAHSFIRKLIAEIYDEAIAENMRILYGGSAKPENTAELMAQKDIDGLLVGGASLKADSFSAMIAAAV